MSTFATRFFRRGRSSLARDESGATAIEFAIVALPFLALVFVIIESGLNFFAAASLDDALRQTTRNVQIGVAHKNKHGVDQFREEMCKRLPALMSCDDVAVDLRPVRLLNLDRYRGRSADGLAGDLRLIEVDQQKNYFSIGCPGDYMLARAVFKLPSFFGFNISMNVKSGNEDVYIVTSSRAFRNEPFPKKDALGC